MSGALFACSKCFSRHPFDELSQGQQLCKECRGSFPLVKCTYCRSEFQQESKSSTAAICKKCESMVKQHGKPSACDYCNVIAAFIGNKCQRCANAEKKYGPPMTCDQCKQKCAFDRKDEDKKKVDGKLLCWLCTLSYRRALAKTKVTDPARHSHVKLGGRSGREKTSGRQSSAHVSSSDANPALPRSSSGSYASHRHHHTGSGGAGGHHHRLSGHNKRPNRPDVTKIGLMTPEEPPSKVARRGEATAPGAPHGGHTTSRTDLMGIDTGSSDQLVIITTLRESIVNIKRQLAAKDAALLAKDRQITELKATHFTESQETRLKHQKQQKEYENKIAHLTQKIKDQNREIAQLSKGRGKVVAQNRKEAAAAALSAVGLLGVPATPRNSIPMKKHSVTPVTPVGSNTPTSDKRKSDEEEDETSRESVADKDDRNANNSSSVKNKRIRAAVLDSDGEEPDTNGDKVRGSSKSRSASPRSSGGRRSASGSPLRKSKSPSGSLDNSQHPSRSRTNSPENSSLKLNSRSGSQSRSGSRSRSLSPVNNSSQMKSRSFSRSRSPFSRSNASSPMNKSVSRSRSRSKSRSVSRSRSPTEEKSASQSPVKSVTHSRSPSMDRSRGSSAVGRSGSVSREQSPNRSRSRSGDRDDSNSRRTESRNSASVSDSE